MSKLAIVSKEAIAENFDAAASRPDAEIVALPAAAKETPKMIIQQQRPRYASEAEEKVAMRQQQWDGFGSLDCRF